MRPFPDYVRASDLIEVTFDAGGLFSSLETPVITGGISGFPQSDYGVALQRHGLFLNTLDQSQWSPWNGGTIRITVGPTVDFSHLQDVADVAAVAAQELGFTTWSTWFTSSGGTQSARFLRQVADDITPTEAELFGQRAAQVDFSQSRDTFVDRARNFPNDVRTGVARDFNDFMNSGAASWLLIGGVALVLVVAFGGMRTGRR